MRQSVHYLSPQMSTPRHCSPPQSTQRCKSPRTFNGTNLLNRAGSPFSIRVQSPSTQISRRALSPQRTTILKPKTSSSYLRITSSKSIKSSMLPAFIQIQDSDIQKYLLSQSLCKIRTADTTANESRMLSGKQKSFINEYVRNKSSFNNDVHQLVFAPNQPEEEIILSIGDYSLTRGELLSLKPGITLNDNVIDACLKCIKQKSSRMFKQGKVKERIYCFNTKYCKQLYQGSGSLPNKLNKNLLLYNYWIFPINVGYWTVLIVNTKGKSAKYYDPIGIEKNDDAVFKNLFALIRREIKMYEKKDIENTRWQRLEYERVNELEAYEHTDAAVYIVRQTFRVAFCKDLQVRPEVMAEYRNRLLFFLFKYGNKITY